MPRELTPEMRAETTALAIKPATFVELDLPGEYVRLWSGVGPLWGYAGVGDLGRISVISESAEMRAAGISLQLSGLVTARYDYVRVLLDQDLDNRMAAVLFGYLDPAGLAIPHPVVVFKGYMDSPEFVHSGEFFSVSLPVESRLIDLERPRVRRYTDADQQARYPGDRGCEFVPSIQDAEIPWGRA